MRQLSSRSDECRANLADYHLKWVARVVLRPLGAFYSVHEDDLAAVPISGHGVYVFCRQYGRTNSPLYIGRSKRLRQRIREHLERVSLVSALAAGEPGRRIVLVAQVEPRPGQCAGRVAQEVESAANSVGYDFSGVDKPKTADGLYGLRYSEFVVPLVKAIQELSKENQDLKKRLEQLEGKK